MKPSRRSLVTALLIIGIYLSAGVARLHADEFTSGAEKFITSLAAKAEASLLTETISPTEHQKRFRALMLSSFDLKGVGKWALGRYWRRASKAEHIKYLSLFEKFVVATYSKRFRGYTKAKLQITGTTKNNKSVFVNSQIKRKGSKPIKIIWRVSFSNGQYKIIDIIIEGVSWVQTQRSEFVSVIRNSGGKISGLIKALDKKVIYLTSSKD